MCRLNEGGWVVQIEFYPGARRKYTSSPWLPWPSIAAIQPHISPVSSLQVNSLQMHGTGTALGDPIEVNAALTVLLAKGGGEQPLVLSAHKASAGHAEPAAGMVGLAYATLALEGLMVPALTHLR